MIRFGPSGNSKGFYESGLKSTVDAAKWVRGQGLSAFEYSFGRGINMTDPTAAAIGKTMAEYDVQISVHAPYYINLANPEEEMAQKSYSYILNSLRKVKVMGGKRCVIHAGTQSKMEREEAVALIAKRLEIVLAMIENEGLDDMILCPETMGKFRQIGTVEEIVELCKIHPMLIPCLDFGHINSYTQGALKTADDYRKVIDYVYKHLGEEKAGNIHIHFSKIRYGAAGEINHLDFTDTQYGPEFDGLAVVLKEYNMTPVVICESAEIMAEDALIMKQIFDSID